MLTTLATATVAGRSTTPTSARPVVCAVATSSAGTVSGATVSEW